MKKKSMTFEVTEEELKLLKNHMVREEVQRMVDSALRHDDHQGLVIDIFYEIMEKEVSNVGGFFQEGMSTHNFMEGYLRKLSTDKKIQNKLNKILKKVQTKVQESLSELKKK